MQVPKQGISEVNIFTMTSVVLTFLHPQVLCVCVFLCLCLSLSLSLSVCLTLFMALDIVECGDQVMKSAVAVPQSIPGLVTKDILVMTFLEGEQITRLKVCTLCKIVTWPVWTDVCCVVT